MLGNRTLQNHNFDRCLKTEVVDNVTITTELWLLFCSGPELNATCNDYFSNNNVTLMQGIPGLKSGVILGQNELAEFAEVISLCIVKYYDAGRKTAISFFFLLSFAEIIQFLFIL